MEQTSTTQTSPADNTLQSAAYAFHDLALKFAPKVTFYKDADAGSEERYLPCSIDFILDKSILRKRGAVTHPPYRTNKGVTPSMDWFKGAYHIMFQDHGGNGIMHIISTDAVNWKQAKYFHVADTRTSSGPSVIAYKDKLHLFYRDIGGNGIMHRYSNDGENWSAQEYIGINGDGVPHALIANNRLFVTTVDGGGSGIMLASTDKAEPRRADFKGQYTQFTTGRGMSPTIAWFKGAYHIMFRDGGGNGIMHITSPDAVKWQQAASFHVGNTKTSDGPCLVADQNQLHLFYRDHEGNGIMYCATNDGITWTEEGYTGINGNGSPQAVIANNNIYVITADGGNNDGIMLYSTWTGISKPTQQDLATYNGKEYYLEILPTAFKGQANGVNVSAPMYYTVRRVDYNIVLTYIFLYAYQGPQTVRALRAGSNFTCIISNYGIHQGDLEWIEVTLTPDCENVVNVGFAEHGSITTRFSPGEYETEGNHPVVRVAKNGHASYNALKLNDPDWITMWEAQGVPVNIIDLVSKKAGTEWTPYLSENQLIPVGLDDNEKLINPDQPWAKFSGRIGNNRINNFSSATYVNSQGLNTADWIYVKAIASTAEFFNMIPAEVKEGFGPEGLYARNFIRWNV